MLEKLQNNSVAQLYNSLKDATQDVAKTDSKKVLESGNSSTSQAINEFWDMLKQQINSVNELGSKATSLAQSYALGESVPLHQVMVAGEKASIAMELTLQVRNKLVQAYQDMMRMPL